MVFVILLITFALLIWLQRLLYSRYWSSKLTAELSFSARVGQEGEQLFLNEQISSSKPLPLPWLTVKFQVSRYLLFPDNANATVSDDYYREDLFSLGMYQRITRKLPVQLKRRGYFTIKSIDLISNDLLLTQKMVKHVSSSSILTVCPRLIPREDLLIPYQHLVGEIIARNSLNPDPFEFRSIREYQSYDTMRSINWMATARTGNLKVNVHEVTAARDVLILLNVEPDGAFYEERLIEEAIRIAGSLTQYLIEDGVSCSFLTNARDIVSREICSISQGRSQQHVQTVLEQLGRLDLDQKPAVFSGLLAQRLETKHDADPVMVMISLNCSTTLTNIWEDYLADGGLGSWIVPRYNDGRSRLPDISGAVYAWEVRNHGG
ncbi:MAG: DUF58 domain-containing protein [Clostridiaceae bacterium]|nr:DUF58 domain-containing protein [Clostridiaceae bacterium]